MVTWHNSHFQSLFFHLVIMETLVIHLWFLLRIYYNCVCAHKHARKSVRLDTMTAYIGLVHLSLLLLIQVKNVKMN